MRADLIVRTGDQADERVSRQIAPYEMKISTQAPPLPVLSRETHAEAKAAYSYTADIRVPQFGVELHDRRSKGVFVGYSDVYVVFPTFIGCVWWPHEAAAKMSQVVVSNGLYFNMAVRITVHVGDFLGDPASPMGTHDDK
jgi:hypothetical protein